MSVGLVAVRREGAVATVVLNRPEKRNALTPALLAALADAVAELERAPEIRAVVLRGAGEAAFSAGYDIEALGAGAAEDGESARLVDRAAASLTAYPFPVIAMLNGSAFGAGCELALAADIRVAAADVRLGIPAARMGLVYPLPGMLRIVRRIGLSAAAEILLTGRAYPAPEAHALGMANHVVARAELESFIYALAAEIAANAPLALKGIKRLLNRIGERLAPGGEVAAEAERLVREAFGSRDLEEARRAFIEKRPPRFEGR
jgi:enoyl-CoA hydratase/carnithine racemase